MSEKIKNMETHIAEFAPEKVKILVLDVDDTVTRGTLDIKIDTWKELFADQLDKLQEAREIYEFTGKGDRYNIIAHILDEPQEGCHENPTVQEWAKKFEETTAAHIREQGIHPDDLEALTLLKQHFSGEIYLLSATPQASVAENIAEFENRYPEIRSMFAGVIGTPMDNGKAGELIGIADTYDIATEEILMVGDGGSDYSGADGSRSQFVGITKPGSDKWENEAFPKISSIAELPPLLKL